ncbi:MAG: RidA family protein [Deltaproteobacteria bacterium]|jgi:2-iminobutanoate/2-iminopropanoate deaminase|nr:RidA family protein [Deltaproteobacteria bacterium]
MSTPISSSEAPAAIGPYSQAIRTGNLLFISGQTSVDPATGKIVPGGPAAEAGQCLKNIRAILQAAGMDMQNVVKVTVFLTDMANFAAVNEVYAKTFAVPFPARSCVAVRGLPLGCLVEIEAIAAQ